jgi:putative sigma-54 modulation protein
MNLKITGHHLEVTPALASYIQQKMQRIKRHHEGVITVNVVLTAAADGHKAQASLHSAEGDAFGQVLDDDMYAAIDLLADKLDRQVLRHKEKLAAATH